MISVVSSAATTLMASSRDSDNEPSTSASALRKTERVMSTFPFSNSSHPDDIDNDILSYPIVRIEKGVKTTRKRQGAKFFVLTSEEVLAAKRQEAKEKEKKEEEKARRQQLKEQTQKEREQKQKEKEQAAKQQKSKKESKKIVEMKRKNQKRLLKNTSALTVKSYILKMIRASLLRTGLLA